MAKRKINAKGTGTVEWHNGHRCARVYLPDHTRPRYKLCANKPECICASLSDAMAEDMAKAISQRERARVQAQLDAAERDRNEKRLTVRQFGEQWTSGKLYETHGQVRKLRVKKSAASDA